MGIVIEPTHKFVAMELLERGTDAHAGLTKTSVLVATENAASTFLLLLNTMSTSYVHQS